jgi:transcriptional regulator with XRE-family HTH domain
MGSRTVGELVGRNVRGARERRGMTQEELGAALKPFLNRTWSRQAVSIMEAGDRAFVVEDLVALAGALETPVEELLLPRGDTDADEVVVSLPGMDLTYEELLDIVLGLSEIENTTAVMATGTSVLRERVEGLREIHEITTKATKLLDQRLKRLERMADRDWYLARRPK